MLRNVNRHSLTAKASVINWPTTAENSNQIRTVCWQMRIFLKDGHGCMLDDLLENRYEVLSSDNFDPMLLAMLEEQQCEVQFTAAERESAT